MSSLQFVQGCNYSRQSSVTGDTAQQLPGKSSHTSNMWHVCLLTERLSLSSPWSSMNCIIWEGVMQTWNSYYLSSPITDFFTLLNWYNFPWNTLAVALEVIPCVLVGAGGNQGTETLLEWIATDLGFLWKSSFRLFENLPFALVCVLTVNTKKFCSVVGPIKVWEYCFTIIAAKPLYCC